MKNLPPITAQWLLRIAIAGVWLYQGLWNKVLSSDDRHRRIIAEAVGGGLGRWMAPALGLVETLLAVAVLLNFQPRLVAWMQIVLLAGMNGAGLLTASREIPDPAGMITMNFAFAMAIWMNGWLGAQRLRP